MTLYAVMCSPPVCRTRGTPGQVALLLKNPDKPIQEINLRQGARTGGHPPIRLRVWALWGSAEGEAGGCLASVGRHRRSRLPRPSAPVVLGFGESATATGLCCCSSGAAA